MDYEFLHGGTRIFQVAVLTLTTRRLIVYMSILQVNILEVYAGNG